MLETLVQDLTVEKEAWKAQEETYRDKLAVLQVSTLVSHPIMLHPIDNNNSNNNISNYNYNYCNNDDKNINWLTQP